MVKMEDGELAEMTVSTVEKRGEKRNQSVLDDDDIEVGLSIQPPPVATKKHKRHHKKHKTGKEEKKKKRHKKENNLKDEEKEPEKEKRHIPAPDEPVSSRLSDPSRRDYSNRPNDRSRPVESRSGRDQYHNSYKPHPERDYSSGRDRNRGSGSYSSRQQPYKPQSDRIPPYPSKPREEKPYERNRPLLHREEASRKQPLIVRQYDEYDKSRPRDRSRGDRDDKSRHERTLSSTVVTSSHSRRTEVENSRRKRNENEPFNDANGHRATERPPQPRRRSPKITRVITNDIAREVVSSEDSSDSSDSPESESEEEVEVVKKSKRKKEQKKTKKQKVEVREEPETSSEEGEEEEEPEATSSEAESDDSAASDAQQSVSDDESDDDDDDDVIDSDAESADKNEDELDITHDDEEDDAEYEEEVSDEENPLESDIGEADLASSDHSPEPETALPFYYPALQGCRSVDEFLCLNRIEEGTYGVVYRAKNKFTDQIVALKRLKMEKEREGFPITSLREVSTLLKSHHPNIVGVQEIVVGSNVDKIYIVMDYVEHDLKSLMETMKQPFLVGEVKTLMIQLLRGVHHLHDNWILHRDLKTSNLLLSHKGILKIGDFGLAREYGSPLKPYTPIVVTLWYRSPELLLGAKEYSTAVDMWSVGCIFAELLNKKALFPGKSEIMQLNLIFKELGTPSEKIWPGYNELPIVKKTTFTNYPYNSLRKRFGATDISEKGFDLLNRFLTYAPKRRVKAFDALKHDWFVETPKPVEPSMFPTWPAKSEMAKTKRVVGDAGGSPKAPPGAMGYSKLLNEEEKLGFQLTAPKHGLSKHGMGFSLKF